MLEQKKEFKIISKKNPRSLLPNTLTVFGVCLGLSSIKFALDENYSIAVIAIGAGVATKNVISYPEECNSDVVASMFSQSVNGISSEFGQLI